MTENTYGTTERIHGGGRNAPMLYKVRTQPAHRAQRTEYLVVREGHQRVHQGPSLERARTLALMASIPGEIVHLYRKVDDRLTSTAPIVTYFGGERL